MLSPARRTRESQRIAVMDTTLRDGEQTPDVSYTPPEKLQLARVLLTEVGVDRIEIAQARVSEGEALAAKRIVSWAKREGLGERVEIMGYVDGELSVQWIREVGGRVLNLLTKGSERHCRGQLRQTPEQHRRRVAETIAHARRARVAVNVYLEDWSSGVRESFDYVFAMVEALRQQDVARFFLPDTLGILSPEGTTRYVGLMTATWPSLHFEFHGHNDYGLATANCLAAVQAGARGVHTSVNGMGERAGNTRLAEVVAALHDHSAFRTDVDEAQLANASRLVETFSGKMVAANAPLVGRDVFTQTGGIHADGDAKGDLYASALAPARFGRERQYALGKLSGKASLAHNLKALGIELSEEERARVLERVVELGDKKHEVSPADLPYIIADVLGRPEQRPVRVESYRVVVDSSGLPEAEVEVSVRGERAAAKATGDGGYDAFAKAVRKAVKGFGLEPAKLEDFRVRIPPGGHTEALVETLITWRHEGADENTFSTLGVDSDQMAAAVVATEKMLNAVAARGRKRPGAK
jgi:D-citramalate synthase